MVTTQDRTETAWRDQVETRVRVAGSGPPVVFLHGAYGLQWDPFLDALATSHTVYAPELPGTTPGAPDAIKPLDSWYRAAKKARWNNLMDVRREFPTADFIDPLTCFNIGGNKYRLLVLIRYQSKLVLMKRILTHAEYNKGV